MKDSQIESTKKGDDESGMSRVLKDFPVYHMLNLSLSDQVLEPPFTQLASNEPRNTQDVDANTATRKMRRQAGSGILPGLVHSLTSMLQYILIS